MVFKNILDADMDEVIRILGAENINEIEKLITEYYNQYKNSNDNGYGLSDYYYRLYKVAKIKQMMLKNKISSDYSIYFKKIIDELKIINEKDKEKEYIEDFGELENEQYYYISNDTIPNLDEENSINISNINIPVWGKCYNSKLYCGPLEFTLNPFDLDVDENIMLVPCVKKMNRNDLEYVHDIFSKMSIEERKRYYSEVKKLYTRKRNLTLKKLLGE